MKDNNKAAKLSNGQIVKIANGSIGVVCSFNNKPFQIVFAAFTNPVSNWDENLNRNSKTEAGRKYDIVELRDGSNIEDPSIVFKKKFNFEELPLVWKR